MSKAFIFSGQGSQKQGMGADLYQKSSKARDIFENANDILGERFSDFLFNATEDVLMDTRYTQMGIFIYEVATAFAQNDLKADCVAGHSLGEYAALVIAGALSFEETLHFIKFRGEVFYEAFQKNPSAMGAVIGIADETVIDILNKVSEEDGVKLYIANYNGPGQLVITGARTSIKKVCKQLKEMGAKRALLLPMKGVGHSPNSSEEGLLLEQKLRKLNFKTPSIPIYMDVDGLPHFDIQEILDNQIKLMTCPVQWTSITNNMVKNGVTDFYEVGTDDTLQKIVARMYPQLNVKSIWDTEYYNNIKPFTI